MNNLKSNVLQLIKKANNTQNPKYSTFCDQVYVLCVNFRQLVPWTMFAGPVTIQCSLPPVKLLLVYVLCI